MRLVDLVSHETGVPFENIMLLRHSPQSVEEVTACGASIEEFTSITIAGSKYDYWQANKPRIKVVVVIVRDHHDRVYGVYRILGIDAEGPVYSLASDELRESYVRRRREDKQGRRFNLASVASLATNVMITGWQRKERTPTARSSGKLFGAICVNLPDAAIQIADQSGVPDSVSDDVFSPLSSDRREIIERHIRQRRGQQQFRDSLLGRYGHRCMATGCSVLSVLEAAHISPYRGEQDNHPANGLLLRADVHTLFDLDLLGVEPTELAIELHPDIENEYRKFVNAAIVCGKRHRPSEAALRIRYEQFRHRLNSTG